MQKRVARGLLVMLGLFGASTVSALAQEADQLENYINQIRGSQNFAERDQGQIARWVAVQLEGLNAAEATDHAAFKGFLDRLDAQYANPGNSGSFAAQLATQTANVATDWYGKANLRPDVGRAVALALVTMNRPEVVDGLIAGLGTRDAATRALCARGLAQLRDDITADNARLGRAVRALRVAGIQESSPTALTHIYIALALPDHLASVFDVYMELFDKRLDTRRASQVVVDCAEVEAFEYFRLPGVLSALSADQKAELARRLAVFLRLDAQRYNTKKLAFYELAFLERRLDAVEAILSTFVPGAGGDIRGELAGAGHDAREAVLQQAYLWVGNPETNEAGALNAAPWNVPSGAP